MCISNFQMRETDTKLDHGSFWKLRSNSFGDVIDGRVIYCVCSQKEQLEIASR